MLSNLFKSVSKSYKTRFHTSITRAIISNNDKSVFARQQEDEEKALKIEASLFDNSSVKYEPSKKEEILKKTKKRLKPKTKNDIISRPQQFPTFKKSRLERVSESKLIKDDELGLEFLKLNLNDPKLSTLLITARSKKRRDKDRQIILEGKRLISEALECNLKLKSVIFSQKVHLAEIKESIAKAHEKYKVDIYKVPQHDLKTWSTLTTPPGIMAIFERPSLLHVVNKMSSMLPITVVCDNIREPNNLGSIIRTCAAVPCQQIVITRGCCDPWESKALRGGCGGHFRVPIRDDVDWQDVPLTIPPEEVENCCIFIAENNIEKLQNKSSLLEYSNISDIGSHNVVIIGGESHGVSQYAYE